MSSILILLGIIFSIFVIIRPFRVGKIKIDMASGPLLVLLVLLLIRVIDLDTISFGILGDGQIKPWEIMIIFFSVAYVSISTDVTGIFDYLAYKVVQAAKGSGIKLFVFFYLFAGVLSIFTSNDIVILTLTPIIFYLSKHAKINILPLLFAEFFAANTMSMFLYIDNPTNIMVVSSSGIGFLEYVKVMWLPTVVAGVSTITLLYLVFRNKITRKYKRTKATMFEVRNWFDAVLSSGLLLTMLIFLSVSQHVGMDIWKITLFFCVVFIAEDICFGLYYRMREHSLTDTQKKKSLDVFNIPKEKNEFLIALRRMPWKIFPFIFTFFVLVQALNDVGVISSIAVFVSSFATSLWSSILGVGALSIVLANVMNNQPMTILLLNVLLDDSFSPTGIVHQGAVYAVIVASNLGANITIVGALAGLMRRKILRTKNIEISYLDFLKVGVLITPIVFLITIATLYFVIA